MRIATAAEIKSLLRASDSGQNYLPLLPRSPSATRLRGIGAAEVMRTTETFLKDWLPSINLADIRDLLERLDIGCAVIPDSAIDAGYAIDSGIIGMRLGFIDFLRHRAAVNVLTAAAARMQRVATEAEGADLALLANLCVTMDDVLKDLDAKTFEFALRNRVDADPLCDLPSGHLAEQRDTSANGSLIFALLHEYGHAVIRRRPLPTVPPTLDEALILPVKEEFRLDQYEEHLADAIACRIVPEYARPWMVVSATVFFGHHIVLEDLCYDNLENHPRAANRIALLLHYTDIADRYKNACQVMAEMGTTVVGMRRQAGLESESLSDRRRRTERYVQSRNPDVDATNLIAVLAAFCSLEEGETKSMSWQRWQDLIHPLCPVP